jgi:hypothetical protein
MTRKGGPYFVPTVGQGSVVVQPRTFGANFNVYPIEKERLWNEWYPCTYFQRQMKSPARGIWTTLNQESPVVDHLKWELSACFDINAGNPRRKRDQSNVEHLR